jgi:hypothetical protein
MITSNNISVVDIIHIDKTQTGYGHWRFVAHLIDGTTLAYNTTDPRFSDNWRTDDGEIDLENYHKLCQAIISSFPFSKTEKMNKEILKVYPDVILEGESLSIFKKHKVSEDEIDAFLGEDSLLETLATIANGEYTREQFKFDVMSYNEIF